MKIKIVIAVLLCSLFSLRAKAQAKAGQVDVFMGVDFNYRDIYYNDKLFELLVNLTPGMKWNLGHRWEVSAQALVPIINDYGDYYKRIRINNLSLSKQMALGSRLKMKASGGLFCSERYGLDLKALFIVNEWLAITGQAGLTGHFSMANEWNMSKMTRLTGLIGPELYIKRWNIQADIRGGRYIYGDYGGQIECFRHFKHTSIGVYGVYSDKGKEDCGFKVVVMLPPYNRKRHKVNFRPASNFRLTYSQEAEAYANKMYFTDPEENERTGWFARDLLPWGQETMAADFKYKEETK